MVKKKKNKKYLNDNNVTSSYENQSEYKFKYCKCRILSFFFF